MHVAPYRTFDVSLTSLNSSQFDYLVNLSDVSTHKVSSTDVQIVERMSNITARSSAYYYFDLTAPIVVTMQLVTIVHTDK